MLLLIALFLMLGGIIAVSSNPDTFSPSKFLLVFYLLFHIGALEEPPDVEVLGLMAIPLALILVLTVIEGTTCQYLPTVNSLLRRPAAPQRDYRVPILIWAFSFPALFAQIVMIQQLGGIEAYVASVSTRVADWSGYGWARTLIATMSALNVAFFAVSLVRKRDVIWWGLFGVHFVIVLFVGAMSGSRSGILNIFALLFICFHYQRRSMGLAPAGTLVTLLVGAASLLGVARSGFSLEGGQVTTGLASSSQSFSFNSFTYGIEPLTLIAQAPRLTLAHGSTFASLLTNPIPRAIFPDKPDTGGVFLTKNYAGDAWEGYSNLTPTFMGEWIINFGWLFGVVGFVLTYGAIVFGIIILYKRVLRNPDRRRDVRFAVDLAIYVHLLWSAVGLMIGELTNVTLGLVLTQLAPLYALRFVLTRLEGRRQTRPAAKDLAVGRI